MVKVSIIIPCYNQAQYLRECLDSVMAQTFQDFEVIVVDDGSTAPGSREVIESLNYPKTQIVFQKNKGASGARNVAIRLATGKYIFPLDADDKISSQTLEKAVAILEENPEIGIVGGKTEFFGLEEGIFELPKYSFPEILGGNCLVCSCMFRRSDWEKVGGYNPNMVYGLEDYDFWLSLIEAGVKVYQVEDIFLYYRKLEKSRSTELNQKRNNKMLHQIISNHSKLYRKYPFYKKRLLGLPDKVIKRRLIKILCLFVPIKSWRHKLRSYYRNDTSDCLKKEYYNTVMSVGAACFVPDILKEFNLRDFSGPFDWMVGAGIEKRLALIEKHFQDYFNYEDFEFIGKNPDNGKYIYKNKRTGIIYNHDFTSDKLENTFEEIAEKYQRRIVRVLNYLNTNNRLLFVYAGLELVGDKDKVIQLMEDINKEYSANVDLLFINNNPEMELKKYKELERISPHVFYSEYRYQIYPDELFDAREILKKLLRKVVK